MKCPVCIEQGKKSRLDFPSVEQTDEDRWRPEGPRKDRLWNDEEGRLHSHDRCFSRSWYACSNGHYFSVISESRCGCGWSSPARVTVTEKPVVPEEPDASSIWDFLVPKALRSITDPKVLRECIGPHMWPSPTSPDLRSSWMKEHVKL